MALRSDLLGVKVYNVKYARVRDIQHNLNEVLVCVERGEEVLVFRRQKLVARLLPPGPPPVESPDFITRARRIWGQEPRGKRLSEIVEETREAR